MIYKLVKISSENSLVFAEKIGYKKYCLYILEHVLFLPKKMFIKKCYIIRKWTRTTIKKNKKKILENHYKRNKKRFVISDYNVRNLV